MESLPLFIAASLTLIATPGPDMLYVLTRGMANGRGAGVLSAAGITAGILVHTLAAALGLAVLLQTSATVFTAIKILGGLYLIYLGWQSMRRKSPMDVGDDRLPSAGFNCFIQGCMTNVLNPKVALFFLAFLPQFIDPADPHHSRYMILMGLIFAILTFLIYTVLALFSDGVGKWLRSKKAVAGKLRFVSGTVLMLLGLRLLTIRSAA